MMFDDTLDVVEVFCEQHEDVLLKHRDGQFTGHQVKTRESNQPVWKANEDQVRRAFVRFVELDAAYPNSFRAFKFLTSHPLHAVDNATALPYILLKVASAPAVADLPSPVNRWLQRIATEANSSEIAAFRALKKATASDDLPKLRDSLTRLVEAVTGSWPDAGSCSLDAVRSASVALVDECGKASSLDHQQVLPGYLPALSNPVEAELLARIGGKRMSVDRVRSILGTGLNGTASLAGNPNNYIAPGGGSTDLMRKKLDAGGFSAVSLNSAKDLRDKADHLGLVWMSQHGKSRGLSQYDHVRSVTLNDAARAYEATKTKEQPFGAAMREELRRRFRERREHNGQLFDCSDEHLEGVAYSLTAQCQIQWSINRPWEDE